VLTEQEKVLWQQKAEKKKEVRQTGFEKKGTKNTKNIKAKEKARGR